MFLARAKGIRKRQQGVPQSEGEPADEGRLREEIRRYPLPRHIAIIMDGNGRWARERGLPRAAGHRAGVEALRSVVKACDEIGLAYLTLFCFSTENWKRPQPEVDALMHLLVEYVDRELEELADRGVVIRAIGHSEGLLPPARASLERALERTRHNEGMTVTLALNYGGRQEIVDACRSLAAEVLRGNLQPHDIDEALFARHLNTAGMPDPDLLIRPSGEMRVSNFLLWQMAYTEFWVTKVYWPDFRPLHLYAAIADYQHRERRFGGLKEAGEEG